MLTRQVVDPDPLVLNRVLVSIFWSVRSDFVLAMRLLNFLFEVFLIDLKAFSLEWNKKLLTCMLKLLLLMACFKEMSLTLTLRSSCHIFW